MVIYRKNDSLSQAQFTTDLEAFGQYRLNPQDIMFQMVDKDFDNDDNPYLEMKFRMTTLKDGVYEKIYIPLVKCKNENLGDFQK